VARIFAGLFLLFLSASAARATIRYTVSLAQPDAHLFHVTMTIPDVHGEVGVQLPAWNATYQIRDFASHVEDVQATDDKSQRLPVRKLDKLTWQISGSGTIHLTYGIYWDESGPFAAQLNANHAFVNFAMVLFYVPDRRKEDLRVDFADVPAGWRAASALHPAGANQNDSAPAYVASNYDALADGPVELGTFEKFQLEGITPPVYVTVHGEGWNRSVLADGLGKIVRYETQLMGGAPYSDYNFLFHIGLGEGGGMEHANSTAIGAANARAAITTSAHEFFHLWNVKRIRPQTLEPIDYTQEMRTQALWFAEGVTSTYGSYTMVRTGLWTTDQFYGDLAGQITELQSRPARQWQSVEESSLDAWFEKYPMYRGSEFSISYYNKGQLDGVLLDVLIRDATDNHRSLDDVLRSLNDDFAKRGRFYNDSADIEKTAEAVAGVSFKDFFAHYVAGTDEIPYADILAKAGLTVTTASSPYADLGFDFRASTDGSVTVESVYEDSSARQAGVQSGDVLDALNGQPVPRFLGRWLNQQSPGDQVKLRLRRGGQEKEVTFTLGSRSEQVFRVQEMPGASEKQRRIREGLLQGKTD
jgi:predicted metalloprotease with PDZ domain